MNREINQGNKIIYQKMYRKERQRQLTRLQQIRNKPHSLHLAEAPNPHFRQTSLYDSDKHLEVERTNIALFNRIATILKEKPKVGPPRSRSYVQSLDQALFKQEKKQGQLRQQNENILRRISNQQPTIRNDDIYKDRRRNERYLSFIGRFPFRNSRRTHTEYQIAKDDREQVFRQKSLDFDIGIVHRSEEDEYMFVVKDLVDNREYQMVLEGSRFKEELASCELSYEKLIGRLRMEKNGEIVFADPDSRPSHSAFKER